MAQFTDSYTMTIEAAQALFGDIPRCTSKELDEAIKALRTAERAIKKLTPKRRNLNDLKSSGIAPGDKGGRPLLNINQWARTQLQAGKTVEDLVPEYVKRTNRKPYEARKALKSQAKKID